MPPAAEPRTDSRQRLITAARELLWQGSYGSVSVDDICRRAEVNKGSFYHFFPSKSELASAAFAAHWDEMRPALDAMFSPLVPPLERIGRYCAAAIEMQTAWHREHGQVLGCPYTSLGCETAGGADGLSQVATGKYALTVRYFTAAIADAQRAGQIPAGDPEALAHEVQAYVVGVMAQARVGGSLAPLGRLADGVSRLLGARIPVGAGA